LRPGQLPLSSKTVGRAIRNNNPNPRLEERRLAMLSILSAVFQFIIQASDSTWTCSATHREPHVAGTFYLYCAQMSPDGIERITVGHFISDAKARAEQIPKP